MRNGIRIIAVWLLAFAMAFACTVTFGNFAVYADSEKISNVSAADGWVTWSAYEGCDFEEYIVTIENPQNSDEYSSAAVEKESTRFALDHWIDNLIMSNQLTKNEEGIYTITVGVVLPGEPFSRIIAEESTTYSYHSLAEPVKEGTITGLSWDPDTRVLSWDAYVDPDGNTVDGYYYNIKPDPHNCFHGTVEDGTSVNLTDFLESLYEDGVTTEGGSIQLYVEAYKYGYDGERIILAFTNEDNYITTNYTPYEVGTINLVSRNRYLVWDSVVGADSYKLEVNGKEVLYYSPDEELCCDEEQLDWHIYDMIYNGDLEYKGEGRYTYTVTITALSQESRPLAVGSINYTYNFKGDLSEIWDASTAVSVFPASATYTGKAVPLKPTVKYTAFGKTKTLKEGIDYTVCITEISSGEDVTNPVNAGTYEVYVMGKDNYTGQKSVEWTMKKASQKITAKAAAGSVAVGKTTTISVSGNKGTKSFKSSDTTVATVDSTGKVTAKKVGTVTITATSAATTNYNAATAKVTVKVVPAATSSVTAANQATGIKVSWKKVTGATGYYVYRNGTKVKTITSGSTVSYSDTKANTNGTKYTYKIVAYAKTGTSTLSKSASFYRVSKPSITSLKNAASKKMTVKWSKNAKASGYEIQYATNSSFKSAKTVKVTSKATVSKTISKLTKGKTYYVRVRTYKTLDGKKCNSVWSAVKKVKIAK